MRKVLYVNCCIRGEESRTSVIANSFVNNLPEDCFVEYLNLMEQALVPLTGEYFKARQALLEKHDLNHPRFFYAHQFAEADIILIAAPFWDLSFPSLLKVYIEQISVDGITFRYGENGLCGLCKATDFVYITSRGGFYTNDILEMGSRYMEALNIFYGTGTYHCIAADGMDVQGFDNSASLDAAVKKAIVLASNI